MSDVEEYDDREGDRTLLYPFVVVRSAGGPFDDESFVAGVEVGRLHERLAPRSFAASTEIVRAANVRQIDLVAMHAGYRFDVLERLDGDEWVHVGFTRIEREDGT